MIPANSSIELCSVNTLAERYQVPRTSVANWVKRDDFPASVGKAGKTVLFDVDQVDAWLRGYQPGTWMRAHPGPNPFGLPEGGDRDLLTLHDIGELHGRVVFQREPTPAATLLTYISRGELARADRTPEDGLSPEVTAPSWFRATAYAFLNKPRRANHESPAGAVRPGRPVATRRDARPPGATADLVLPQGRPRDLLSLAQIREIDTAARGRPAPSEASIRQYMATGKFPKPDRTPGDGKRPAVTEPKWYRDTAYGFVRRPSVGQARKP